MGHPEESAGLTEAANSSVPGEKETSTSLPSQGSPLEVFRVALRLGLTSLEAPLRTWGTFEMSMWFGGNG